MTELLAELGNLDPVVVYGVVFTLALLESAALAGLVVPGEATVLLGGALVAGGTGDLAAMCVVASLGAIAGDSVGYELGRRTGPWLQRTRVGRAVGHERWAAGESYLLAKGGRAVFLGRFVAVVRALVPVLAGVGRMPYRRFLLWNAASGVIWGTSHVVLGYVVGRSYARTEGPLRFVGLSIAAVVVVAIGLRHLRNRSRAPRPVLAAAARYDEDLARALDGPGALVPPPAAPAPPPLGRQALGPSALAPATAAPPPIDLTDGPAPATAPPAPQLHATEGPAADGGAGPCPSAARGG